MRTITPLGDNIIVKGTIKKSAIVIQSQTNDRATVEKLEVWKIGDKVEGIKVGMEVRINPRVMMETERLIDPYNEKGKVKTEQEFFIVIKPEEVVGIFK